MTILYCLIVLFSGAVGVSVASKLKKREVFFSDFLMFLNNYESNLLFMQESIDELIRSQVKNLDLRQFLLQSIASPSDLRIPEYISQAEGDEIKNMIRSLSCVGLTSCEQTVGNLKQIVKRFVDESAETRKKYATMYIKISILIGLLVVVILL